MFVRKYMFSVALFATAAIATSARADEPSEAAPTKVEASVVPSTTARLVESAKKVYTVMALEFQRGLRQPEDLYQWSRRWRDAELATVSERILSVPAEKAVAAGFDHRIGAAKSHLERMKKVEELLQHKMKSGAARPSELLAAQYYVAAAQRAVHAEGDVR